MKLLLFSDLHLDRTFAWAPRVAGRRRRMNLRTTLSNITSLARDLQVDALLCGGDLFEHERFSADGSTFLKDAFADVDPIPVYLAPGNHDWYGPESPYKLIDWSPNVRVFSEARLESVELAPGLTLWGAGHRAPANTPSILDGFRVDRGGINIALFHGSEQGFLPFVEEAKQPHAPFRAEQIEQSGLDHALLGHFHTPKDAESYTYPGNPDPLEFGEHGDRGVVVVDVGDSGDIARERRAVAVTMVHDLEIDLTGCNTTEAVRARVAEVLPDPAGWVRLTLRGAIGSDCVLHPSDLQDLLEDFEASAIRSSEVGVAYDLDALSQEQGTVRAAFVDSVRNATDLDDDQKRRVLVTGLRALDGRDDLEMFDR